MTEEENVTQETPEEVVTEPTQEPETPIETSKSVVEENKPVDAIVEPDPQEEVDTVETEMVFQPIPDIQPRHKNLFADPMYSASPDVNPDNPNLTFMESDEYEKNKNRENR